MQVMTDWPQTVHFTNTGQVIGRRNIAAMRAVTRQMAVVLGLGSGVDRRHRA